MLNLFPGLLPRTGLFSPAPSWLTSHSLWRSFETRRYCSFLPVADPGHVSLPRTPPTSRRPLPTQEKKTPAHRRDFATMARKRKTGPASPAASTAAASTRRPAVSPPAPDPSLRRSNRRKSQKPTYEDKASEDEGDDKLDLDKHPELKTKLKPAKMLDESEVTQTIKELEEMDNYFRRETKRQRLMAEGEGSNISTSTARDVRFPVAQQSNTPSKEKQSRSKTRETLPTRENDDSGDTQDGDYVQSPHGLVKDPKEESEMVDEATAERGAARPPAVNSSYLPLPWKGRLGYACLNTYLREAKPPVFSSRTCRMASIVDHRHALQDPSQPEHAIKNRPDKTQKADAALGHKFVQQLGLANARDIVKMMRWNDKYGIKFMRLSSEMFPFASHPEHGYTLAPFASEVLAEAGKVAAELGHRLTTHPGQFTQLGSPRKEVIDSSIRDLVYHDELLTLLKLPEQPNRDAVMIMHMGGVYGDKAATLDRFRTNYARLPPSVKARLVLENDDVSWSVHDLLPVCEELNIPLVLDFHHNNIIFDSSQIREGTFDISQPELMDRIIATWKRKGIRPKMHYSEPCPGALTPRDRRKHSPRVMTLPPCPPDMDLMIEAKDKEQAVFELMRTFKLPGFAKINDIIPHEREDECKPPMKVVKIKDGSGRKKKKKKKEAEDDVVQVDVEEVAKGTVVPAEDLGMGGPMNRVYWPLGMEDWLKPKKREVKKKTVGDEMEV